MTFSLSTTNHRSVVRPSTSTVNPSALSANLLIPNLTQVLAKFGYRVFGDTPRASGLHIKAVFTNSHIPLDVNKTNLVVATLNEDVKFVCNIIGPTHATRASKNLIASSQRFLLHNERIFIASYLTNRPNHRSRSRPRMSSRPRANSDLCYYTIDLMKQQIMADLHATSNRRKLKQTMEAGLSPATHHGRCVFVNDTRTGRRSTSDIVHCGEWYAYSHIRS